MLNQEPSPEEPAIESLLAGFAPKENAIDRERLMFLAGYQAAKQEFEKVSAHTRLANRRWKFLAFVSSAAAAGLALFLLPSFPASITAERNVDPSSATAVDVKATETPKVEGAPKESMIVAMSAADETRPPTIGPENGCLRLRDQVLRGEGFAVTEISVAGGSVVSRPPATRRQLFLELPVEVRGILQPAGNGSSSHGSSRLGERS